MTIEDDSARAVRDGSQWATWSARVARGVALPLSEAWEYAVLTEETMGPDAALPMYKKLVERAPEDAAPLVAAGRILLDIGDPDGVALLERAMVLDHEATTGACQLLFQYYRRHGDDAATQACRARLLDYQAQAEASAREREGWSARDALAAHGLSDSALANLRDQLRQYPRIVRVYLARKVVRHFPNRPLFVCGLELPWWFLSSAGGRALVERVAAGIAFPGDALVISVQGLGAWRRPVAQLRGVPGALIYQRNSKV